MNVSRQLEEIYQRLDRHFGDLRWWPGQTPFEIIVGAILTQNTSWGNVEKAIRNLKTGNLLSPLKLGRIGQEELAQLIRPSGYYNIKARRLRSFLDFLKSEYRNSLKRMFSEDTERLREKLLGVNGIGEETADSILLYAGNKPAFVVDAYTRRILERHGLMPAGSRYGDIQRLFLGCLSPSVRLFNQYHALIVKTGNQYCRKTPRCEGCPLNGL